MSESESIFDPKTGIEVRIKPRDLNDPYHEYPALSTSLLYAEGRNETFIEAVTDERYVVEVVVHPIFQWKTASHLSVLYLVDGGTIRQLYVMDKPHMNEAASTTLSSFTNVSDGRKVKCGLTFGGVIMSKLSTAWEIQAYIDRS